MLITALWLPALALAYSSEDMQRRRLVLTEVMEAARYADSELPPCEGIEHLTDAVARYEPPAKTCPDSRRFFDAAIDIGRGLSANCRQTAAWMESTLSAPTWCADGRREETSDQLRELRRKSTEDFFDQDGEFRDMPGPDADVEPPQGEMVNMDCHLATVLAMQYRKRALSLANKHFGRAEYNLDAACSNGEQPVDYSLFLR